MCRPIFFNVSANNFVFKNKRKKGVKNAAGSAGFPQRLENEGGHGKLMEHEKLAKSHEIL